MAKIKIPAATEISKYLSKDKFLPIYFLCGKDQYTMDLAVDAIERAAAPLVLSDFDREIISADKSQGLLQVLDLAYSFPFGGGKKLIFVKNFEKFNEKKELSGYIKNPPEFTILVITQTGKIPDPSKEPYSLLLEKRSLFEARIATGDELIDWIVKKAKQLGMNFPRDIAQLLVDIVGEEKTLLEMQLQKAVNYLTDKNNITSDDIIKIASPTKEHSIFNLQDVLGKGDISKSIEIAFNLLNSGMEVIAIINMLSKFVLTLSQIMELSRTRINDNEAASLAGVSWGYYFNCKKAGYLLNDERLLNASRALLSADTATKTTSADPKTVLLILISEMLGEEVTSISAN
ncbi:MAG: DNA polymerase III subunit delta [Ignavibacteriae bacterium HGW-Ignavibacteriae-3]|nr:MAG: DNA polymerase III subunit delta [Ignavibacteriae bacterium HGW-Ignavibacteriae-3]